MNNFIKYFLFIGDMYNYEILGMHFIKSIHDFS